MRSGRVPGVLQAYLGFCTVRERYRSTRVLQLDSDFVYPTTLLPLAVLSTRDGVELRATSPAVQGYADWIMSAGEPPNGGTYLPLVRLPSDPARGQTVLGNLEDLSKITDLFSGNREAYHFLLGELVDNIYEHSRSNYAYVMAQYYRKKGVIEASFIDDGITIPRSLQEGTGMHYSPSRAHRAIYDALKGKSSKPGGERGFGLPSTTRIVNELGGTALVVSGRGALVADPRSGISLFRLSRVYELDGTLVTLRLPESDKTISLYDLVE